MTRREFGSLLVGAAAAYAAPAGNFKITSLELIELHGEHEVEAGVNGQHQVNPLDIYDEERPTVYKDNPRGTRKQPIKAIYLRIHAGDSLFGLYGPIDREVAIVVAEEIKPFLIGKDPLAGERLWDEMYRSNRHSRAGIFLMAISAVDNTLWDLRGRHFGVPVYRLLGGPTRSSVEVYASCLGFSLEPEAVRKRCLSVKADGYRNQKWFMGYGPGAGPEGMRRNVELVKILRETLGDDTELMFDAFSGWDLTYALEWARQVEQYRPRWIEEAMHPEKIESFVTLRRSINFPVASGEHFYGRWEVEHYLERGRRAGGAGRSGVVRRHHRITQDRHGGVAARRSGDSARPQYSRRDARNCQPIADDVSARRIFDQQDAVVLSLRKTSSGAGQSAHSSSGRTRIRY